MPFGRIDSEGDVDFDDFYSGDVARRFPWIGFGVLPCCSHAVCYVGWVVSGVRVTKRCFLRLMDDYAYGNGRQSVRVRIFDVVKGK